MKSKFYSTSTHKMYSYLSFLLMLSCYRVLAAEDDAITGPRPLGVGVGVFVILLFLLGCVGATLWGILHRQFCYFCSIGSSILLVVILFIVSCPRGPATKSVEKQIEELGDVEKDTGFVYRVVFGLIFIIISGISLWQFTRLHLIVPIRANEKLPR